MTETSTTSNTTPITTAGAPLARAVTDAANRPLDEGRYFHVDIRPDGAVTVYADSFKGIELSPDVAKNVRGLLVAIEAGAIR
jgi:hypothetical protein